MRKSEAQTSATTTEPEAETKADRDAHDEAIARVLEHVALPETLPETSAVARGATAGVSLRTAQVRAIVPGRFVAIFRGGREIEVALDDGVDPELVQRAATSGDRVLIEEEHGDRRIV